jgi:hypothetical protein
MLRRAKISQYEKQNFGLKNDGAKPLISNEIKYLLYKT